ncbi:MAG: SPFH domain-containing protein [Candidatus Paceibacterota bacterium]
MELLNTLLNIDNIVVMIFVVLLFAIFLRRTIRIIPQGSSGIVERLGRYNRTLTAGLTIILPFVDRLRPLIDMREQVVSFPPQPVITEDNLVVSIDTVIYFQVTNPKSATYEIENFITGIEQLTVTTLRNAVGGLDLEAALTSRDSINNQLRVVLDEATGKWGVRVNRVEIKAIEPPASVQESMEKQMRAERERRAAVLSSEGEKQSQILTAEGEAKAAILKAEGYAKAAIIKAEAEAEALRNVFEALHKADINDKILAYSYLQQIPTIANGSASKLWLFPVELSNAMQKLSSAFQVSENIQSKKEGNASADTKGTDV